MRAIFVLQAFVSISLALATAQTHTQKNAVDAEGHPWWQHAVFYEIYPRSFADSNHDGVGDLKGITGKLDYLKGLGVDAIWISPCYPSPQVDFGYDVSDYENIDPMYGTLADFDRLATESRKHNIRIILDYVINHTSDQHKWFLESKSSKASPYRNWYIWLDGKTANQPPNNWLSTFGGSAWKLDPKTGQYYYHYFYPEQPDLNWRNPAVEKAMFDVTRWWYKRGVSGFRLDAVDTLFEDPDLRDNPTFPGTNKYGDPNMEDKYNKKLPEVHDVLTNLRTVANEYNAVLIGETWTRNFDELKEYYGAHANELQLPMDFMFTRVDKLDPVEFRRQIAGAESAGGWPTYVISNHDIVRSYNRYGDGIHNDDIAKLMAAFYLTLRGTPIMYYGEELGMENNDAKRREDVRDPIGRLGWPVEKGRDGERTPMQWSDSRNAGFSTAPPWLPVPASYKTHNVASESKDPNSVLEFYRKVLALRHTNKVLLDGNYVALNTDDPNVLSYLRSYHGDSVLVALNMSGTPQKASLSLPGGGSTSGSFKALLATPGADAKGREVSLPAFGVYIADLEK